MPSTRFVLALPLALAAVPPVRAEKPKAVDFSALEVVTQQEMAEKNVPGTDKTVVVPASGLLRDAGQTPAPQ